MTLLLAVETSSVEFGLALADDGVVRAERTFHRNTDSAGLGGTTASLLAEIGVGVSAIGRLAVDVGPGNLGTVRSGIAYANGLAFALGLRIAAVDGFELLAREPLERHGVPVLCLRRAGGVRVYAGLFRPDGTDIRAVGPMASVVPELGVSLAQVFVAGCLQHEVAAVLPGVDVVTSGIELPSVGQLVALAAQRDAATDVGAASPVNEVSAAYGRP